MKRNIMMQCALAVIICGASVFTSCSNSDNPTDDKQHYEYLNAAETREDVTEEQRAEYAPYVWRLERKNKAGLPKMYRTCLGEFVEVKPHQGYDSTYEPSRKGLAQLKMSGSSSFSDLQLDALVSEIRKLHSGPITIVDLRKETHGLLNGYHVSLFRKQNWANIGLSREAIIAEEKELIHNTI